MQALQWAISYPKRIKKAAIIAASSKISYAKYCIK